MLMGLDEQYLIADTSFGKVLIEQVFQSTHPITDIIDSNSIELNSKLDDIDGALEELHRYLSDIENKLNCKRHGSAYTPLINSILSGWQINGSFICGYKNDVHTVRQLFEYFLIRDQHNFQELSRFNQIVILELIEQLLPELIIKYGEEFKMLKSNPTIIDAFE